MIRPGAGLFVLVVAASTVAVAQDPPAAGGMAVLTGHVVDARDGAALPRARIVIITGDRERPPVLADERGRFTLEAPGSAPSILRVSRAGYATTVLPLPVRNAAGDVEVALARGAAIEGRVVSAATGLPMVAATVGARRADPSGTASDALPPFVTETDDRGDFRLGGLPAGTYDVLVLRTDIPPMPQDLPSEWRRIMTSRIETAFDETAAPSASVVRLQVEPGDLVARDLAIDAPPDPTCRPRLAPPVAGATTSIGGRVTDAGGRPLACVTVRTTRSGAPSRTATTGADGRYRIEGLTAGAYTVEASLSGYVPLRYGQTRAGDWGTIVTLADGEPQDRIDLALPRGSAIAGTVVDEAGEPMAGVVVRALELQSLDGRTIADSPRGVRARTTDDQGRYRLFGLMPARYLIEAAADADVSGATAARMHGYAPVYFPGTTDLHGASPVRIDIGTDVEHADLAVAAVPTARLTGVVLDRQGQSGAGARVLLITSFRSGVPVVAPRQAIAGPDGSFVFANVPPGDYVMQASTREARVPSPAGSPRVPALPPSFGMQFVTVTDTLVPPIVIRTSASATLEGSIRVEGPDATPDVRIALMALPADLDRAPMMGMGGLGFEQREDGRFTYAGLHGPVRLRLSSAAEDWYLKSAVVDGQDVTDRSFDAGQEGTVFTGADVVVSTEGATIEGRATDARGASAVSYGVVVFPLERAYWFMGSRFLRFVRADQDGAFRVRGLPPGHYRIVAVDGLDGAPLGGEWQDPAVLEALLAGAQGVDVTEGARLVLTLRVHAR